MCTARRVGARDLQSDSGRHVDDQAAGRRLLRIRALQRQYAVASIGTYRQASARRGRRAQAFVVNADQLLLLLLLLQRENGESLGTRAERVGRGARVRVHEEQRAKSRACRIARRSRDFDSGSLLSVARHWRRRRPTVGRRSSG